MAFQMSYIDPKTGASYPESYWKPVEFSINQHTKTGAINFWGYASQQARLDGRQPVSSKLYRITPEMYDSYLTASELTPEGANPYLAAYDIAINTLEGIPPVEGDPETRVSFFSGAVQV